MDIVIANGFAMERCAFFSREYHCCVLHNTRCKCEDYNPRNSKPITNYDLLRAKSVEEMAEFMNCGACPPGKDVTELCHDEDGGSVPDMCNLCWLDWLKKEAEA